MKAFGLEFLAGRAARALRTNEEKAKTCSSNRTSMPWTPWYREAQRAPGGLVLERGPLGQTEGL